jgi:hypothetical protein
MFTRVIRYVYMALIWVFLAGLMFQIFLAGVGLFDKSAGFGAHAGLGWILHLVPVLLLVVGGLGRVGWRLIAWNGLLLLLVGVQPFLPGMRGSAPLLAALHPVNAVLIVVVTLALGLRVTTLVLGTPAVPRCGGIVPR